MKRRISPVLLVLILIVLVAAAGIGTALIRRYMPSGEKMDGSEYFSLNDSSEAALVVNRELKEEKAKIIDGRYYIENTVVGEYINGRFYWDEKNQVMLYTLPTEMFQISPDTTEYQTSRVCRVRIMRFSGGKGIPVIWIWSLFSSIRIWNTRHMMIPPGW